MALIVCPKCGNQFQGPMGSKVSCPYCRTLLETLAPPEQEKRRKQKQERRKGRIMLVIVVLFMLAVIGMALDGLIMTQEEYNKKVRS